MGKTAKTFSTPVNDGITETHIKNAQQRNNASTTALVAMNDKASAIAAQVGYEGSLTVGGIEDEIRFYQRKSVEALLETGKRLLVLKELTAHGEFEQRVQLLGFSLRTAVRFMHTAAKVSKSAKLADLSSHAKNSSAFLELITHDDDVIDQLGELDDFDKMSATQLREKARELTAEAEATDKVLQGKQDKITSLERAAAKKVAALTDWPAALEPMLTQVQAAKRALLKAVSDVKTTMEEALRIEVPNSERPSMDKAFAALGDEVGGFIGALNDKTQDLQIFFGQTLENFTGEGEEQGAGTGGEREGDDGYA